MRLILARKYQWINGRAQVFFTVLLNSVGRLVKTLRNATVITTVKNPTVLQPTESGTFFLTPTVYQDIATMI